MEPTRIQDCSFNMHVTLVRKNFLYQAVRCWKWMGSVKQQTMCTSLIDVSTMDVLSVAKWLLQHLIVRRRQEGKTKKEAQVPIKFGELYTNWEIWVWGQMYLEMSLGKACENTKTKLSNCTMLIIYCFWLDDFINFCIYFLQTCNYLPLQKTTWFFFLDQKCTPWCPTCCFICLQASRT